MHESVGRNGQRVLLPDLRSLLKRWTTNKGLGRLQTRCDFFGKGLRDERSGLRESGLTPPQR
ncbi:MAG: hypothetical protein JJ992_10230, partial [Planctomycetes bacterium]|nr:hypothetical protein [Planctomycetota bacterium]